VHEVRQNHSYKFLVRAIHSTHHTQTNTEVLSAYQHALLRQRFRCRQHIYTQVFIMKIQGKTALVTGASRGIGRAIAVELAKNSCKRLLLVARNRQKLAEVAQEIEAFGTEVIILPLDLTQIVSVNIAIAKAWKEYGPIHLLVNCAGVAYQAPFLDSKLSNVKEELETNLISMYTVTRLIARRMATQGTGAIVNVSSLMGKVAAPTMATYSATKFAILGFTQALRCELAERNIRVLALLPSLTDTDMVRDFQLFQFVVPTTAQKVAATLIYGLEQNQNEILVGWQSHLAVWCNRIAPWLLEMIVRAGAPSRKNQQKYYPQLKEAGATSH
jgi:3-oxoacyl-[acyl-carrier protein] reductase